MLIACWSAKGGVGTTVVTAGLALILSNPRPDGSAANQSRARREADPVQTVAGGKSLDPGEVLIVDLAGDIPAVLGMPEPTGPGVADWLAAGPDVPPEGLARIEVRVTEGLAVIPLGSQPLGHVARAEVLAGILGSEGRHVIIDCGRLDPMAEPSPSSNTVDEKAEVVRVMVSSATQSLLVTRACYLALRRYLRMPVRPSGVVLLSEPGRSLSSLDVEAVCDVPVVAEVAIEPAVARAVDSGLLAQRVPRGLARALLRAA